MLFFKDTTAYIKIALRGLPVQPQLRCTHTPKAIPLQQAPDVSE